MRKGFRIYETPFVSSRYLFASNVRIFEKEQDAKYPDLRRFRRLGQNVPLGRLLKTSQPFTSFSTCIMSLRGKLFNL